MKMLPDGGRRWRPRPQPRPRSRPIEDYKAKSSHRVNDGAKGRHGRDARHKAGHDGEPSSPVEAARNGEDGLESVKKTHQVAAAGKGPHPGRRLPIWAAIVEGDMSLRMAQGMKRLGMPIVAFLALALIGLIAMSWFLNRDALRQAVEAQIRAVTGLDLVVKGTIDVSVFPGSYVSFHDVGLKGGGTADPALSVD